MKENVTILSIDDDPQICFALGELFKFQGWRAVSASDVASGLEAFRRYSPDIVLIDYHMPGVSGIEGVKLLRRQSSSVPIIVFTIDESQTVADTFLAAGASDFALKPIKAPDIVSRISLHLRFAGQNRPEPALSKGISGGTLDIIMNFLSEQSDYVTACCLGKRIVILDGLREVLRQQKAIGNNLNQLTVLANMGKVQFANLDAAV